MEAQTSSINEVLQYGILGVVALAFAWTIIALYKRNEARIATHEEATKKMVEERVSWGAREQTLRAEWGVREQVIRADYEARYTLLAGKYAESIDEIRIQANQREDLVRREFSELMERVAEESAKSSQAVTDVLHKFYDRLLTPRSR